MADSIVTVTQNNVNKIVTVGGQILKAPVNAGNLQETKSYTVSAAGTSTISPDSGYDAMGEVALTVPTGNVKPVSTISNNQANISSYGTSVSLDATISNTPTVVTPGYVSEGSAGNTNILLSATDSNFLESNIKKNVTIFGKTGTYEGSGGSNIEATKTCNINSSGTTNVTPSTGYDGMAEVKVIVPVGDVTPAPTISSTGASISVNTDTITLSKSAVANTPVVNNAGYINIGTQGNSSVSLTASIVTQSGATYTPTTSNQTIASGTYLTGTQTIKGDANLIASNIKDGVSIFGVTGNYTGSSGNVGFRNMIPTTSSSFEISNVNFSPTQIVGISRSGDVINNNLVVCFIINTSGSVSEIFYKYSGYYILKTNALVKTYNSNTQVLTITCSSNSFDTSMNYDIFYS